MPPPGSVKIKFVQSKNEIVPLSKLRSAYAEPAGEYGFLAPNGESAQVEFGAQNIDSSKLAIQIDTPDDQQATVDLDLQSIR